ncbi:uncharacterized protein LOC133868160 [Alnus glutinosa]|uniref:uncharacterized protein LOC133868160 n=1 Tax=Alnus glutinosa TaxID=3517 RepID=UPI002D7946DF|nr:uncharacterized protein LOC133868160 [Alnus glutinosa]
MANWSPLFDKVISAKDIRERTITTYRREEYRLFADSIPAELCNIPPPFLISINTSVMFRDVVYEPCVLEYSRSVDRGKFVLHLSSDLNLTPDRRLDASFRWIGTHLRIRLEPAVSPQALLDLNREVMEFQELTEKPISRDDTTYKQFRLPQMDVRPFYNICPDEVKAAIDHGAAFSVQIFPPGKDESFGADMLFEKGFSSSLEYCTVTIILNNYLSNSENADAFIAGKILKVWYREASKKLKLAFTATRTDIELLPLLI